MGEWIANPVSVFHGRRLPEPATPAGDWLLLTPRHKPADTLAGHLEFALKWEGVELGVLKQLFLAVRSEEFVAVIREKPTGVYTRRLWFIYEWLMDQQLNVPDPGKVRSVPAVDPEHQYFSRALRERVGAAPGEHLASRQTAPPPALRRGHIHTTAPKPMTARRSPPALAARISSFG